MFYERKIELKNFTFIPGLAFSNFSDVDHFLYPGIDIGYKIRNGIKLNFNSGYTYRVPSYTDLYYNGPQAIGNKNLKPEKAFGNEIGIEYFSSKLSFETAFFIRKSENLIDYVEVEIGGQKIDKHYGEWLDIWGELNVKADHRVAYDQMVGNTFLDPGKAGQTRSSWILVQNPRFSDFLFSWIFGIPKLPTLFEDFDPIWPL